MKQYLKLCNAILKDGYKTGDRTSTVTTIPGYAYTCELQKRENGIIENFPLLTTKFVSLKTIFTELMWKLRGDTNIKALIEQDIHIFTEWPFKRYLEENGLIKSTPMFVDSKRIDFTDEWNATKAEFEQKIIKDPAFCEKWGDLGRTYGHQFRNFGEIQVSDLNKTMQEILLNAGLKKSSIIQQGEDQLLNAIYEIRTNPESRRIIISLWNPQDTMKTLLPPCPAFYQFFANQDAYLHLNMYQRSCNTFLNVPYNTAQDVLFLCLMAHITGRDAGKFNYFGDAHIHKNHLIQIKEQIKRAPKTLPGLKIKKPIEDILGFNFEDLELINYCHDKGSK